MLSFSARATSVAISRSFRLDNLLAAFVVFVVERFGNVTVMGIVCLQLPLGLPSVSTDAVFVYIEEIKPSLLQKFSVILLT